MDKLAANALAKGLPHLNGNKGFTTQDQRQQETLETEIAELPVDEFILDQAPDLTINHAVKLSNQGDVIAKLPVLGEELQPLVPVLTLPLPRVEQELTFIDHQQDCTLVFCSGPSTLEVPPGVVHEILRSQFVVGAIRIICTLIFAKVTIEVPDHRLPHLGADDDITGIVQAFTRAWRTGI